MNTENRNGFDRPSLILDGLGELFINGLGQVMGSIIEAALSAILSSW